MQERALDNAYVLESGRRELGQTATPDFCSETAKNLDVKDPEVLAKWVERCAKLPEPIKKEAGGLDLLADVLKGEAAKAQIEAVTGITIDEEDRYTSRLFEQLGLVTNIGAAAAGLEIAGSAIPTTNLQHAGIAVRSYLDVAGLTQITGFGYGMLFSSLVGPLVQHEVYAKARPMLLDAATAIIAERRGFLTSDETSRILAQHGFSDDYQKALAESLTFHPGAGDLVRFAVRDTFRPDIVAKYGYDEEFPSGIVPYGVQGGVSEFWMKHYWRAHWELPSVTMGYEMLHRGKITIEEMQTLLKIGDVAPWWIPKMIDISYSPYTRVDTRRLFKDGVISREEVLRNYRDIGYDTEKAEKMTEWTCKAVTGEKKEKTRDLTESKVLKAYQTGKASTSDTSSALVDLGYDDDEIKLLLALVDYTDEEDDLNGEWKVVKAEYLAGIYTPNTIGDRLNKLQLPQKQQILWRRQLDREVRLVEIAAYVKKQKAVS